jgi:hypothetical protein
MSTIEPERYIGDGVYASFDPARMIVLRTTRTLKPSDVHWIGLEPEVLGQLIEYACEVGWREVIKRALQRVPRREEEET